MEETLSFKKDGNQYVAEFDATDIVGIHLERPKECSLSIEHRLTTSGKYYTVRSYGQVSGPAIFEAFLSSEGYDAGFTVRWRIKSGEKPTVAKKVTA